MTKNRFVCIRASICWYEMEQPELADNWWFVDDLVEAFNVNYNSIFAAGWLLTEDETMIAWRGRVGVGHPMLCPWRSFVPRKPEPLGVEMKTMADAITGMIIQMEICKGKVQHVNEVYYDEFGHTTYTHRHADSDSHRVCDTSTHDTTPNPPSRYRRLRL